MKKLFVTIFAFLMVLSLGFFNVVEAKTIHRKISLRSNPSISKHIASKHHFSPKKTTLNKRGTKKAIQHAQKKTSSLNKIAKKQIRKNK